ncbi:hypothetical protein BDD12DRAFT_397274 [Trichophaea hybrida]|nr:hypothetical protein BDD12DRAFT_397274 [Trichophaea hybrida]
MCWKCFMTAASRRVQCEFKKGRMERHSRMEMEEVLRWRQGLPASDPSFHAPQREGQPAKELIANCRQCGIRGLDCGDVIDCCSITYLCFVARSLISWKLGLKRLLNQVLYSLTCHHRPASIQHHTSQTAFPNGAPLTVDTTTSPQRLEQNHLSVAHYHHHALHTTTIITTCALDDRAR